MKKLLFTALIILASLNLYSAVPVGIIPFEGDASSPGIESKIKDAFVRTEGITVVADKLMDKVVKTHEKAQTLGSGYHDISKLKVAAYLITGNVTSGKLTLKAVDVNQGTEVYTAEIDLAKEGSDYQIRRKVKEISDMILLQSASGGEEVPEEALPYMEIINSLVSSLSRGDQASYPHMAIYLSGSYRHPDAENKKSVEIAKLNLRVMRQSLNRAKVTFISMKSESGWVYINTVADKAGQKTKVRFGIVELDDGSLAVGKCDEEK